MGVRKGIQPRRVRNDGGLGAVHEKRRSVPQVPSKQQGKAAPTDSLLMAAPHPCHAFRMAEPAKRLASYADIEALPPHLVGEIIDGELFTMSRPGPLHAEAQASVLSWSKFRFGFGEGGPGGWWILTEPELRLHNDIVVPDVAGWRKTRLPQLPSETYFSLVPDWVCEVLSPSTQSHDRARKMTLYAREGVRYAWLVDPLAHLLEVFELSGRFWSRVAAHTGAEIVRVPPFEEVELPLGMLWAAGSE